MPSKATLAALTAALVFIWGEGMVLPTAPQPAFAQEPSRDGAMLQAAQSRQDPAKPRRHFRLRNPADLSPKDATTIYKRIGSEMEAAYRLSRHPVAESYRSWRRYNRAPYRSSPHGNRYVNNYANGRARDYGKFELAGRMPVGSVIAKDSFTVTEAGTTFPGPLFAMEKMAPGFKYVTGDWRYTMIMPDGSIYGQTNGASAERVEFCIPCHLARERYDHLFFVPKAYRVNPRRSVE